MKKESNVNQQVEMLRMKDLSAYLGIPKSTLYHYQKEGRIKGIRVSAKVVVFNVEEVKKSLFGQY